MSFTSRATDLVADSSGTIGWNAYLWDRDAAPANAIRLVSHTPDQPPARSNGISFVEGISADGRYLLLRSTSTDLILGYNGQPGLTQVYFWDRLAASSNATRLVSHASTNAQVGGNRSCFHLALAAGGRYVTYGSDANDLVPGGTSGFSSQIYLWDRDASGPVANRLVSHTPAGATARAGGSSWEPQISADGRFVAFFNSAGDVIAGGTGAAGENVYFWDRDAAVAVATRLVTHTPASSTVRTGATRWGVSSLSADGRYLTYTSGAGDLVDPPFDATISEVYQWDRDAPVATANRLVSHASGQGSGPASGNTFDLAADSGGRFVVFRRDVEDLSGLGPLPTPPVTDLHLWDREAPPAASNRLVSHALADPATRANGNSNEPAISGDGLTVAFTSEASDLVAGDTYFRDVFAADVSTLEVGLVSALSDEVDWPPMTGAGYSSTGRASSLSADGRYVVFTGTASDVVPGGVPTRSLTPLFQAYLWDSAARSTRLVSHTPDDASAGADADVWDVHISANGRYVTYQSTASNLIAGASGGTEFAIYFWDRDAPTGSATRLISHTPAGETVRGNGVSREATPSADGRFVAYTSESTDLIEGSAVATREIFLWDRDAPGGTANRLVSHIPADPATPSDRSASSPEISADGRFVAYHSLASDLVDPPAGGFVSQVYLWDRLEPPASATRLVSHTPAGATVRADRSSYASLISANDRYVVFESDATDLVPNAGGAFFSNVFVWDRLAPEASANRLVTHRPTAPPLFRGNGNSRAMAISADGRWIGYQSHATNLIAGATGGTGWNVYLWDRDAGSVDANRLVSHTPAGDTVRGNGDSYELRFNEDVRTLVFDSTSTDLIEGETGAPFPDDWRNIYRRNLDAPEGQAMALISHSAGSPTRRATGSSSLSSLSADGREVAFFSTAPDLVSVDLNDTVDSFWWTDLEIETALFADGLESGDTSGWSETGP